MTADEWAAALRERFCAGTPEQRAKATSIALVNVDALAAFIAEQPLPELVYVAQGDRYGPPPADRSDAVWTVTEVAEKPHPYIEAQKDRAPRPTEGDDK